MKTLSLNHGELADEQAAQIVRTLGDGGLVCLPCNSSYRILADLNDEDAVNRLLQSKRRTRKAPSLVFIDRAQTLQRVVAEVDPQAEKLAARLWPGPLTILFTPHPDLPRKVVRQLCKANGRLGVRVPDDPVARRVLERFGGPLLVSSANKERKQGAGSPAQVRKTFMGRVDLFVDAGDLAGAASSTVVELRDGRAVVTRPGAIAEDQLRALGV